MASQEETQEKVDAALDAALDDLDDDDDDDDNETQPQTVPQPSASRPVQGPMPPPAADGMEGLDQMMKSLMQGDLGEGGGDEFLGRLLQEMQTQIGAELETVEQSNAPEAPRQPASKSPPKPKQQSPPKQPKNQSAQDATGESDVDQAISSLIEGVANQAKSDDPNAGPNGNEDDDDMLKNMMNQLGEGLGGGDDGGFNPDVLIDGMMEQLLARDLMYEPMKSVAEKFPSWLEQNKGKIPQEEYDQRCQQYKCFQKLVHTYDTEPENTQLLMLLMQEVQEFGQPPPEIIADIAPGLELDADGLPKMDGTTGLPPGFPAGDEECRIM